jgi:hypothetical protein
VVPAYAGTPPKRYGGRGGEDPADHLSLRSGSVKYAAENRTTMPSKPTA